MALVELRYFSAPIQRMATFMAVLPEDVPPPFRVVYQLHGLSDDHSAWSRRSTIEPLAEGLGLAVVMPHGERSYYCDVAKVDEQWEAHLLATIDVAERLLPLRRDRAGRGVGGLSMGGYGALKLGLKHPDRFASVAVHSSLCDLRRWTREAFRPELAELFPRGLPAADDLFALARRATGPLPALRLDCGTEDFLLEDNRRFHALLTRRGIAHDYVEFPGGHTWDYWQAHVGQALAFHAGQLEQPSRGRGVAGSRGRQPQAQRGRPVTQERPAF